MQLSFLSYLFRRFPLEYSFAAAGRYGFDGVEIWGARPHAYPPDLDAGEIADIRRAARENRVRISAYTPELSAYPYNLVSPLEKEREETQQYLARALEIAAELEAERVLFTLPHPGYAARREKVLAEAVQRLKQLSDLAQRLGVKLMLETLSPSESSLITTADEAQDLLEQVASDAMTVMLDLVPPTIANEPLASYLDRFAGRLDYVHVCNSDGASEFHAELGQGVLPLQDVFDVLQRHGFDGWYSIELLSPYFRDPELYLANSKRLMDSFFRK